MNLVESISARHSVRKYSKESVNEDIFKKINEWIINAPRLHENIDIKIHVVKDGERIHKISKGIIGSYGKIEAPHYLVITSEEKEGYLENIGFTLERIVLELTTLGVGTCWIGGFIKKELLDSIIEIPKNHKPIIVIAFGYEENGKDIISKSVDGHKRKKISEFCSGDFEGEWINILELIRKAPSAVNSQPWRFFKSGKEIDLFIVKRNFLTRKLEFMNKIDAGIALCHLYVAGEAFNKKFNFKKLQGKEKENLNYILTAIEKM